MKKSEKKLSKTEREELQFLIEGFLEKDNLEIFESFRDKPDLIAQSWDQLEATLFKDRHWLDEVDPEELAGVDLQKLTLDYHSILKPIWEKLKSAKFDYQDRVLSLRKDASALMKATDTSPLLSEYRELIQQGSIIHSEQFYEIKLTISFDPGHLTFYKRSINVLLNFVDFLGSVPNSYFARCAHCDKCIIKTRSDKEHCPGCAKKKHLAEKWKKDPEGMRKKERKRCRTKRKAKPQRAE